MQNHRQDTNFTRRKFTITERLDDTLTDMAESHYQGNVSLCIRASIEDHRSSLNGTGDNPATQQLAIRLESILEQQASIKDAIESVIEENKSQHQQEQSNVASDQIGMSEDMRVIFSIISEASDGLRFDDISERSEMPISQIQSALGSLVDKAIVEGSEENPTRFYLAGSSAQTSIRKQVRNP